MNILVIGGEGYLGSEIVYYLSERNYAVQATARSSPLPPNSHNLKWIKYDLNDAFSKEMEKASNWCDVVLYTASSIKPSAPNNGITIDVNREMHTLQQFTIKFNNLANKHFIYISSGGSVYGELQDEPLGNNELMTEVPIDSYGKFKLESERIIQNKLISFKNFSILRISNIYSFYNNIDKSYGLITNLKKAALSGAKFRLLGDGNNTRDYINVFDVLRAVDNLINIGPQSTTINLGTGIETSVFKLIDIFNNIYEYRIKVEPVNYDFVSIKRSKLNIQNAISKLNWQPSIDLVSGVNQYLSY